MKPTSFYAVLGAELVELTTADSDADIHSILREAPAGIYSAWRSFTGRFLRLPQHLERCRRGIVRAGWSTRFDKADLIKAIDSAARAYPGGDFRLRLDLLEQPTERYGTTTSVLMALAPHEAVPAAILEKGADLDLAPEGLARSRPEIKFTEWVRSRRVCEQSAWHAYEHLLLDERRCILEGTSSNFFALIDGSVVTAPGGVLEGITRQLVLELVERLGVPVQFRCPALHELANAEEAFITSSTRGIVPVSTVAGAPVGTGLPGPFAKRLLSLYAEVVEDEAVTAHSLIGG